MNRQLPCEDISTASSFREVSSPYKKCPMSVTSNVIVAWAAFC